MCKIKLDLSYLISSIPETMENEDRIMSFRQRLHSYKSYKDIEGVRNLRKDIKDYIKTQC